MSQDKIREQREKLDTIILECFALRDKIRERCDHSGNLEYKYCGDGGSYYDKAEYWIDWKCKDCGKIWSTDHSIEFIDAYPNAVRVK